jgi:hypothetical protein
MPPVESKCRAWSLALRINRRCHRRGQGRPITPSAFLLLDYILWKAPRAGCWMSEATLAERIGRDVRTVQRAKAVLARYRLILVLPRLLPGSWPVRVGSRIHFLRKGMRTSDEIRLPDLRAAFPRPRHFTAVGGGGFASCALRGPGGRFLPAAARRRMGQIIEDQGRLQATGEGGPSLAPTGAAERQEGLWETLAASFRAKARDVC